VLRPLRTLTSVESMRVIVQSMLSSFPALVSVMLLCAFIFLVFGIVGVQLWPGTLRGRCMYMDPETDEWTVVPSEAHCAVPCSVQEEQRPGYACIAYYGSPCQQGSPIFHEFVNATADIIFPT